MKGIIEPTIWNIVVVGVIALIWIVAYNEVLAGKQIGSLTFGRA